MIIELLNNSNKKIDLKLSKNFTSCFFNREKDFLQERESLLQQQGEKDQQYNSLVKSLKDRVGNSIMTQKS